MKLILLSLILISLSLNCNHSVQYPKQQLINQLLRVRPDVKQSLSTSFENDKGELQIDYYTYNLDFVNSLRRLEFICWIAGKRYKPCEHEGKLGFCHHYESCKGWFIFKKCKSYYQFVDINEHEFLLDGNALCHNRKKEFF